MANVCNKGHKLPSCIIHEHINNINISGSNYNEKCQKLQGRFYGKVGVYDLCKKLAENLNDICTKEKMDDFLKNKCLYLQYWLNHQIIEKFGITDNSKYAGLRSQFYNTWTISFSSLNGKISKCTPNRRHFISLNYNDVKDVKDMYDYYYNCEYFKKNHSPTEHERSVYCSYLSSMNESFTKFKNWCSDSSNKCIPNFKNSIGQYDPKELRKILNCDTDKSLTTSLGGRPDKRVLDQNALEGTEELADPLGSDSFIQPQDSMTSSSALIVSLTFFGMLIMCFLLFKLTPIGSLLHNKIIQKGKITEYINGESSDEMLNEYFMYDHGKSQEKGCSIPYHSV
ncbi:Plasmodium vivax Vir protein, putative [Plasmodium ovale]|uniref:Plasmodium vivax Vir protein, putative n=1 Tax=Plasmodium ovale TaxID=36330 RepID=A0A1C3KFX3_PLAOA|nr:Plasmodium vivax Vir protein, putative [Plasmodium ovale]